tara:strand:+ start:295 stop:663 length:369 start_codon:yes stop_codon:yes gene_type:complete
MQCGKCTECCTPFSIPELRKPAGLRCMYLTDQGCSIYETRPQTCRDFQCAYLILNFPRKLRPDRAGFIIRLLDHGIHGHVYACYKIRQMTKFAKKLIRRIRNKYHPDRKILWAEGNHVYDIE